MLAVMRLSTLRLLRGLPKPTLTYSARFLSHGFAVVLPDCAGFSAKRAGLSPKNDIRLISAMVAFSMFERPTIQRLSVPVFKVFPVVSERRAGVGDDSLAVDETDYSAQAFRAMVPLLLTQGIVLFQVPHWCMCYLWPISSVPLQPL